MLERRRLRKAVQTSADISHVISVGVCYGMHGVTMVCNRQSWRVPELVHRCFLTSSWMRAPTKLGTRTPGTVAAVFVIAISVPARGQGLQMAQGQFIWGRVITVCRI